MPHNVWQSFKYALSYKSVTNGIIYESADSVDSYIHILIANINISYCCTKKYKMHTH